MYIRTLPLLILTQCVFVQGQTSNNSRTCVTTEACARLGEAKVNSNCAREVNFTQGASTILEVAAQEFIKVRCNNSWMDILGRVSNDTVQDVQFRREDNGKKLSCYDDSNGERINESVITVVVYEEPTADNNRLTFTSYGEPISIEIIFNAYPTVARENVTVMYKGSLVTDFYYQTSNESTHKILLHFSAVTEQNQGEYRINVSWVDPMQCKPDFEIVAVLRKTLHIGWITTITLGSLSFVLSIAVITCIVLRSRGQQGRKASKVELNVRNGPDINSTTANGLNQQQSTPLPGRSQGAPANYPSQFQQGSQSLDRYSDDEFESDDSICEPTTKKLDKRPPMPLPKENHGNYPPRSPGGRGYVNGASNFSSPQNGYHQPPTSRNLPPPPVGNNRASPAHRTLPPPPTSSLSPQGYRGQRY